MSISPRRNESGKGMNLGGNAERCPTCQKRVYAFERLLVDGVAFHRGCFKCCSCSTTLKPSNYYTSAGKYYCKSHYTVSGSRIEDPHPPAAVSAPHAQVAVAIPAPPVAVPQPHPQAPLMAPAVAKLQTTGITPSSSSVSVDQASESRRGKKDGKIETARKDKKEKKEKRERDRTSRNLKSDSDETPRVSGMPIEQLLKDLKAADEDRALIKAELQAQVAKRKVLEKNLEAVQLDLASTKTALKDQLSRISELETALAHLTASATRNTERMDRMESIVSSKAEAFTGESNGSQIVEKKKKEGKAVRFSEEPKAPSPTSGDRAASGDGEDGDEPGAEIKKAYKFKRKIGKGATAIVYEGKHKKSGRKVAIKKIKKAHIKDEEALLREFQIVKELHHPNIVEFYESFEDSENYYLVMELVEGKELFEKILEKGFYSERDAVHIIRQIVNAIVYLHEKGIAHRDLKPENLLSSGEGSAEIVKITDFGLSKCFKDAPLKTMCGSSVYISPEVVEGQPYDKVVDMWSLGVIVYILLCGYPPWKNPPEKATALIKEIISCQYTFHEEDWKEISPEAKDFITKLLVKDPAQRYTALQAKNHPWLAKSLEGRNGSNSSLERSVSRLKIFLRGENVPQDWEVRYQDISGVLGQPIAEGAFAFVYKIIFKGKPVAVKKIKFEKDETDEEEMTEDFKKEVSLMATLRHDNIVQFVAASIHFPNLCILTDWYNKGSLNDLLHKKSLEFPWELKMKLCREVAAGLNYLHTRTPKIIHRDVKAENVFIDDNWTAKLGDFGLSKIKLDSKTQMRRAESMRAVGKMYKAPLESRIEISKSGTVGTPAWIAPEILDMKPYSERADVYSYGVFLWEVYTRKLPHSDKGDYSIAMGVLCQEERPEIPLDCPAKFAQLMTDCWRTKSEERPSCEQIMAVFQKYGDRIESWR